MTRVEATPKTDTRKAAILLIGGVFLFGAGFMLGDIKNDKELLGYFRGFEGIHKRSSIYTYISPLVGVDSPEGTEIGLYDDTNKKVRDILEAAEKNGTVSDAALYYRDLVTSTWFGVQEDKEFFPASLLKIIFALAAYKQDEMKPGTLAEKHEFTKDLYDMAKTRDGEVLTSLKVGESYSIEELVNIMLIDSDNSARDILATVLEEKIVADLYHLIGIKTPEIRKDYKLSAADYSLFLRILYNSKYLNEPNSEKLLAILARTTFNLGLAAGVPTKTPVAHKFGVHVIAKADGGTENEVHDCGIVYVPDSPYLLCIMTKGNDQNNLVSLIHSLSETVYKDHTSKGF